LHITLTALAKAGVAPLIFSPWKWPYCTDRFAVLRQPWVACQYCHGWLFIARVICRRVCWLQCLGRARMQKGNRLAAGWR